jgi:regulation of enolase protein 1 (concanavalin A-like superfamily)
MNYTEQLKAEQNVVASLRTKLNNIRLPSRTINWQHRNISSPINNIQYRLEVKRQKLKINNQINSSQNKIISLRSLIFGDGKQI